MHITKRSALPLYPSVALANFIWPPTMMYAGLRSWWIIPVTLGIEFLFYRFGFKLPTQKAAVVTVVTNMASAAVGLVTVAPFFANGVGWMFMFHGASRLAIVFLAPVALGLAGINFLTTVVTIVGNLAGMFVR